jgi:hypothetical protein
MITHDPNLMKHKSEAFSEPDMTIDSASIAGKDNDGSLASS